MNSFLIAFLNSLSHFICISDLIFILFIVIFFVLDHFFFNFIYRYFVDGEFRFMIFPCLPLFWIILALELKPRFWKLSSGWQVFFLYFFLQFIFSIPTFYGVSQSHMPGRGLCSVTWADSDQVGFVWFICCCLGPSLFYLRWFLKLTFFFLWFYPHLVFSIRFNHYFFIAIFLVCQFFLIDIFFQFYP